MNFVFIFQNHYRYYKPDHSNWFGFGHINENDHLLLPLFFLHLINIMTLPLIKLIIQCPICQGTQSFNQEYTRINIFDKIFSSHQRVIKFNDQK